MSIFSFIKGLMGKASAKPEKKNNNNQADVEKKAAAAAQKADQQADQQAEEAARQMEEALATYHYADQVTIGDTTYKLNVGMLDEASLYASHDGGKKWELLTELPIITRGLTTDAAGGLVIIGQYLHEDFRRSLLESATLLAAAFTGDENYNKAQEKLEDMREWSLSARAYKFEDGQLYVDKTKGSVADFSPILADKKEMTLCMDALDGDDILKKEMKANGLKKVETVKLQICNFLGNENAMFSLDGKRWLRFKSDLPKNFKGFAEENGIVVATDKDNNKYFYYQTEWNLIDFEADQEIGEDDVDDKVYGRLTVDEKIYPYGDGEDKKGDYKAKTVHLLICAGRKGFMNDGASIYYIANDHVRRDAFNEGIEMKVISGVSELFGDVLIRGEVGKKTVTQVYSEYQWRRAGAFNPEDDEEEEKEHVGPFCFETYILEDDPFWDKVDSPIEEFQLDAKKNSFKARKMIVKAIKNEGCFDYLGKSGHWLMHSQCPNSIPFTCLYNTGVPEPVRDKKTNAILYYNHLPMTYQFIGVDEGGYCQWIGKKKGLFNKHIEYGWNKLKNPTDREMMVKLK